MRARRKRNWKIAGILAVLFIAMTIGLWCFFYIHENHAKVLSDGRNAGDTPPITAIGFTEAGMDPVVFPIDFLKDTHLCVETVYLSDGDVVEAGEKYLKFTQDSIDRARAELERAVQRAELAYQSKVLASGEEKIQAKYTYDTALLEAQYAPQVYQDTLTQLQMQLVKTQKSYEEAQAAYNAYLYAVENNTFYQDYQIEERKKAYEDAYDLFASRRAYWEVTAEELEMFSDIEIHAGQSDRQWIIRTVALLKEEMMEAKEEYEQARQDYQREIESAERKLQMLLNQYERAQQAYIDAQSALQRGSFQAKTLYELTIAKGQTAENDYNICMINSSDELEQLKDAKKDAVEKKVRFEQLIGDGYLYTEREGEILMVQTEEGQMLAGGEWIFAYKNPKKIFVSAIAPKTPDKKLVAGEKASVTIENYGSFDGVVESICPIESHDKIVLYDTVMVSLEGDIRAVCPNQTATVIFGEDAILCSASAQDTHPRSLALPMFSIDIAVVAPDKRSVYLEIAEGYVEVGQHIRAQDPVCRLTPDSVKEVKKALTYAQTDACIALLKAQTNYQLGVLEAGLTHNEAMMGKVLAQTTYDNTIAKLNSNMVAKILETEQLLADIYQQQTALTDDKYLKQKAELTRAYDKAKRQMENARACFVTNQVEAAQAFQEAKSDYENFLSQLETSNQQIADKAAKVYALQGEILQCQQQMEKELLTAEQIRKESQMEGEIANAKYAGIVKEYENALRKAQSDFDYAVQRLEDFCQFTKDGTVYAAASGLVTAVNCKKGDKIADISELVYYRPDTTLEQEP